MVSRNMKSTPAAACLKILLTIFTIIFWVIGVFLLGGGIYSKIKLSSYDHLTTMNYSSAPYVMIGIGCFIILIGFMGCFATGKGNPCLLRTYAVGLSVIFLVEIVAALIVVAYRGKIYASFQVGMTDALKKYKVEQPDDVNTQAIDNAQETLHCCGSYNYTDYWITAGFQINTVPMSCCKNETLCQNVKDDNVISLPSNITTINEYIYTDGCPVYVFGIVDSNIGIVLGSMFGVAGFQFLGIIAACCLSSTINSNKYELV